MGSVAHWRDRMYLWDQVKDIPVDVRMATPFQRGNVCEDPERCEAIEQKGWGSERNYLSTMPRLYSVSGAWLSIATLYITNDQRTNT